MKTIRILTVLFLGASNLVAQEDNFNDGDDTGWSRFDPLGGLGAGPIASFEVIDGQYRLRANPSPNPAAAGPGRGGSLRQDVVYEGDFFLSVDIPAYDAALEQAFGLFALVQPSPGLGMTDGYAFTYQPITNDIQISRVVNEDIDASLSNIDLAVAPGPALRLVFFGTGGNMEGRVYNLDDLSTPLAAAFAFDNTYTSGTSGLLVTNNQANGAGAADATFDNYVANDGTLPVPSLVSLGAGEFEIRYPDWVLLALLESSPTMAAGSWQPIPTAQIQRANGMFVWADEFSIALAEFFRLRRP